MSENKQIEVISTAELIQEGIAKGSNLVELEKLLELKERFEKNEARKSYAKEFAIAQANILPVVKNKKNTQTKSNYAELGNIIEITQPIYTAEGFSITFNEGDCPKEGHARILADVLHRQGHRENYHLDIPLDGKGLQGNSNMTPIHGKASSISYGRKYLMCMIWNIPTSDNDGNNEKLPAITDKQLHTLRDLIISKEMEESKLLIYLGIEALEDLQEKDYLKAISAINNFKKVSK